MQELIRPSGCYVNKSKTLRSLSRWYVERCDASPEGADGVTDAELREVRGAEVLHITNFTEQDEAEVKALTMDTLLDPRAYRFKKGGQK